MKMHGIVNPKRAYSLSLFNFMTNAGMTTLDFTGTCFSAGETSVVLKSMTASWTVQVFCQNIMAHCVDYQCCASVVC
jgi:predicted membrane protein